ncbi:MAG: hypothetical protein GX580_16335 [Candidatus Hydrogenedens sp.]|nr:hypothetical protein [Candidatus Hydrogenedentota bacterium]NLF59199.1 hypothetical protein [Candidatus Hydrogenedens sp.]
MNHEMRGQSDAGAKQPSVKYYPSQFSRLGLTLIALGSLLWILLFLGPLSMSMLDAWGPNGSGRSLERWEILSPVSYSMFMLAPLFFSLRALIRGHLPEKDGDRLSIYIVPITVMAIILVTILLCMGAVLLLTWLLK